MELIGKIVAKIHGGTFDGVPEDTKVVIHIPGMKHPLYGTMVDCEVVSEKPEAPSLTAKWFMTSFEKEISVPANALVAGTIFAPMGLSGTDTVTTIQKGIPGIDKIKTPCPDCSQPKATSVQYNDVVWSDPEIPLLDVIVHLNDCHGWSREKIADWLDTKDWDLQFVTQ